MIMISRVPRSALLESRKTVFRSSHSCIQVGIRKMLHLIWVKDNNSSGTAEEAKEAKGVRVKLLDCYRNLYFEAIEGLPPKEQVSRIAKNLVECVNSFFR